MISGLLPIWVCFSQESTSSFSRRSRVWAPVWKLHHTSIQVLATTRPRFVMIFVFVLSTFCMVLYLLLSSKIGGRSPSSDSSMSRSTPALYKRLSQTSLITLLSCGSNVEAYLTPLTNGTFVPLPVSIPDNWHYTPNATWEHIPFDSLWERPHDDHAWKNPIPMYFKIFGYAITEGTTFADKYFPGSRYWDNVAEMERTCFCERKIVDITLP